MEAPVSERLAPSRFHERYYHLRELRKQIEDVAKRYLANRNAPTLVDFGCGSMPYRPIFDRFSVRYTGIDLPRNSKADLHASVDDATPMAAESADIVLSTQVLEHVVSPPRYLEECHRILKPEGLLILTTHGYWMYHPDPTDFWRWTGPGLRKVIGGVGYEILECRGVMGLAASGMHLFQDGLLRKVPRPARPILAFLMQFAVGACDWLSSDAERANDACVFVVVARKQKRN